MRIAYQLRILAVRAEAWIYFIIIGSGIAVIAAAGHVVFQHRAQPYGCYAQRVDVVQMVAYAAHVSAVSRVGFVALGRHRIFQNVHVDILVVQALGKAVGHKQIQHIAGIEATVFRGGTVALLKLVGHCRLTSVEGITQLHITGFGIGCNGQIQQFVVGAVEAELLQQLHSGIIHREVRTGNIVARKHNLQSIIGHSCPPVRRLYIRNHIRRRFCATNRKCAGYQADCQGS